MFRKAQGSASAARVEGKPSIRRNPKKRSIRTLLSPEQIMHAIIRETERVNRGGCGDLSFILFRIPGWRRNSLSAVRLIKTILKRMRVTDDIGWYDKNHVGLLLSDTSAIGANRFAQEICHIVAQRGSRPLYTMYEHPAPHPNQQHEKMPMKVAS